VTSQFSDTFGFWAGLRSDGSCRGEAEVEPLTHSISVIVEEDSEGAWATVPLEDSHCTMVMDAHMPKRDGAGAESRPARRGTLGPGDIRFEAPGGITPKRVTFPAIRRAHRGAKDFASDQSLSSTPRCVSTAAAH
jgi:hypothetical protein